MHFQQQFPKILNLQSETGNGFLSLSGLDGDFHPSVQGTP
jgi:hypothetical protein